MTTRSFAYSGARQSFTVPIGVTSITVDARGGYGGCGAVYNSGNIWNSIAYQPGRAKATFAVQPGQICYVRVGGNGDNCSISRYFNQPLGGYNGGGNGDVGRAKSQLYNPGANDYAFYLASGAGGGGYSDFRLGADSGSAQMLVAAGSGGAIGLGLQSSSDTTGGNATTSAGGSAGTGTFANGKAGGRGSGGSAPLPARGCGAAGGGGGYYGGGSGALLKYFQTAYPNDPGMGVPASYGVRSGGGGHGSNYISSIGTSTTNTAPGAGYAPSGAAHNASSDQIVSDFPAYVESVVLPAGYVTLTYSLPPAAPALALPFNKSKVPTNGTTHFEWTNPTPPEPGDTITGAQIQYRAVGDADWTLLTTITNSTANYDAAIGTFDPSTQVEWQVRSKGSLTTNYGPWSASYFFTPLAPPDPPNIIAPIANTTLTRTSVLVRWDPVEDQQAWQIRDTSADGTVTYFDSGINENGLSYGNASVSSTNASQLIQVRVLVDDLWSGWSTVAVTVSIIPPPAPSVTALADSANARIIVTINNPPPGDGSTAAAVDHNDLYRTDPVGPEIRIATGLKANTSYTDMTPADSVPYTYRAVAVATSGSAASS